ncbi:metallothionein-like protein 3A [Lolium perenne]|uniref:metallothionein-like protein 3A n=1 Tax=Lolium perenne TaxID=4522 RepID=UPI003A99D573
MSNTCGNCDCSNKNDCPKKGNSYGIVMVDTKKSHFEVQEVTENDGKCKCGTSCSCTNCTCGH